MREPSLEGDAKGDSQRTGVACLLEKSQEQHGELIVHKFRGKIVRILGNIKLIFYVDKDECLGDSTCAESRAFIIGLFHQARIAQERKQLGQAQSGTMATIGKLVRARIEQECREQLLIVAGKGRTHCS